MDLVKIISQELGLEKNRVNTALKLMQEGGTVPFIARYRKDQTEGLDETQLRDIQHRHEYLKELDERRATVLKSIEEQGKLTPELKIKIRACTEKTLLEDIYLPFRPKRRTRASVARENGLEPLAALILKQEETSNTTEEIGRIYLNIEKGLLDPMAAVAGAMDILAEETAETPEYRAHLREIILEEGLFVSQVRKKFEGKKTKFESYYDFREKISKIVSHRLLAIRRGEKEKVLRVSIELKGDAFVSYLVSKIVQGESIWKELLEKMCKDAFERLMKSSMESDVRLELRRQAEEEALRVFGKNLRDVLLAPPAGRKSVLALDPGFKSGCKIAVMDAQGKYLDATNIYPHPPQKKEKEASETLKKLVKKYDVEMVAIGNGTASRETDAFASKALGKLEKKPIKVVVSEAGASVYSASPEAVQEFPELDVTTRGAVSIGRRLQDPLSELVKIDPKSIGVGQYQHDVNQTRLKKNLDEVVESCVNLVGVNVNTASESLLGYVAGISHPLAQSIVEWRDKHGVFSSRKELLKVPKFGPKAFEQAAGFLRIPEGENPLDSSAVHPESYEVVEEIAKSKELELSQLLGKKPVLDELRKNISTLSEKVGEHTLEDIFLELEKPGRDPRKEFRYAHFNDKVQGLNDLVTGSWMEGVVTNVTNFGAFVDIGIHEDGLVHISEISDKFVKDAKEVVAVGEVVKVRVLGVETEQKRISLSMKEERSEGSSGGGRGQGSRRSEPRGERGRGQRSSQGHGQRERRDSHPEHRGNATLADLKMKFQGGKNPGNKKKKESVRPQISIKSIMRSGR